MKAISKAVIFPLFLLLSFPLFYFVYKFGDPEPLAHDYFQYYWLYKEFDSDKVIAPHNMRLVGAFFVYLFYKLNFFYETVSAFDKYQDWGFLKQVYFNALLFNYLSVAATCVVLFQILQRKFQSVLLSFNGTLLYLLGFGTLFYELMPGTDAFSVFLFSLSLYCYLEKRYVIILLLVLLIFQREYILIVFSTLALMDLYKTKHRYFFMVFVVSTLCFVIYYVLRKTVFYTPHLDHQASPGHFWDSVIQTDFPWGLYLKQLALTLNVFFIYLGLLIYKKWNNLAIDRFLFFKLMVLFVQINIISYLAGHGTNCGRYFYMVLPMVIYMMVKEVYPLVGTEIQELRAKNQDAQ